MREDIDNAEFRRRLEARRTELIALEESASDVSGPVELDQTRVGRLSRMDAMQLQAMQQATKARREAEIRRIAIALQRLDDGAYGYCLKCDEEIALKRLEFDPSTLACIDCAGK